MTQNKNNRSPFLQVCETTWYEAEFVCQSWVFGESGVVSGSKEGRPRSTPRPNSFRQSQHLLSSLRGRADRNNSRIAWPLFLSGDVDVRVHFSFQFVWFILAHKAQIEDGRQRDRQPRQRIKREESNPILKLLFSSTDCLVLQSVWHYLKGGEQLTWIIHKVWENTIKDKNKYNSIKQCN